MPRIRVLGHVARLVVDYFALRRLVVDYFDYAVCLVASARRAASRVARHRLLGLRRASGCLGSSRGSLSTTSTTPRIRLLRHVARHVARLVAPLVVDYFASRRLVVDYFAYTVCPGASARHAARQAVRRRLLHLRRASGCFGSSRGL
jgi:predicted ABC-type sugar transport system permease subunit